MHMSNFLARSLAPEHGTDQIDHSRVKDRLSDIRNKREHMTVYLNCAPGNSLAARRSNTLLNGIWPELTRRSHERVGHVPQAKLNPQPALHKR